MIPRVPAYVPLLIALGPFQVSLPAIGCNQTAVTAGGGATRASGPLVAYASGYGPDIVLFAVDPTSGALTQKAMVASFGGSPSFLATNPDATNLYGLDESTPGRVGAYAIDRSTGTLALLNVVSSGGNGPAHVSVDATGKYVFVANYADGTVSVLPVLTGEGRGRLGNAIQTLDVGAQAHQVLADPTNHFVFVPCKGADYVAQFVFDSASGKLTPNATIRVRTAPGAGPRHLAFHPNGKFAYVINELDSTMTAYAFDAAAGTLQAIDTRSTLPVGFAGKNTTAEVWVHPSGVWVLGSNRGDDSIVVFAVDPSSGKMTLKGHAKSGGATPRDFTLDPTGTFVYAADQGANAIVPFRFDAAQGALAPIAVPMTVAAASFIGLVRLPSR